MPPRTVPAGQPNPEGIVKRIARMTWGLIALAAVCLPSGAGAQWQNNGIQVTSTFSQVAQAVPDGSGGAILVSYRSDDIYAQHVLASGSTDPAWPVNGTAICTATDMQSFLAAVSDGAGGALITWSDFRSNIGQAPFLYYDIYAQHLLASGVVDPAWPLNGVAICTASGNQTYSRIASDGAGGAYLVWNDGRAADPSHQNYASDVYAQHVLAAGSIDPAWLSNGEPVCAPNGVEAGPMIVADGNGGAIVAWADTRNGNSDVFATRLIATGVDSSWPANGSALCLANADQSPASIVSDGQGGALVVYSDNRSGAPGGYAQHVLASGAPDPTWPVDGTAFVTGSAVTASAVADASGGVLLAWSEIRSGDENIYAHHVQGNGVVDPSWPVNGRQVCGAPGSQEAPAVVPASDGGILVAWQDQRSGTNWDIYANHVQGNGQLDPLWPVNGTAVCNATRDQTNPVAVTDGRGGAVVAWNDDRGLYTFIYANRVTAQGAAQYVTIGTAVSGNGAVLPQGPINAPVGSDQTVTITPDPGWHTLYVQVDNNLYGPIASYTFTHVVGNHQLIAYFSDHYSISAAAGTGGAIDPAGTQTVVAGGSQSFTITPDQAWQIDDVRIDGVSVGAVPSYTFSNIQGDHSIVASFAPELGAPRSVPTRVWLAPPVPNPVHGATHLRLGLPRAAHVVLSLHDLSGRRVATLFQADLPAGEHAIAWNGDAGGKPLAGGVYFCRLEAGRTAMTQRCVVVR